MFHIAALNLPPNLSVSPVLNRRSPSVATQLTPIAGPDGGNSPLRQGTEFELQFPGLGSLNLRDTGDTVPGPGTWSVQINGADHWFYEGEGAMQITVGDDGGVTVAGGVSAVSVPATHIPYASGEFAIPFVSGTPFGRNGVVVYKDTLYVIGAAATQIVNPSFAAVHLNCAKLDMRKVFKPNGAAASPGRIDAAALTDASSWKAFDGPDFSSFVSGFTDGSGAGFAAAPMLDGIWIFCQPGRLDASSPYYAYKYSTDDTGNDKWTDGVALLATDGTPLAGWGLSVKPFGDDKLLAAAIGADRTRTVVAIFDTGAVNLTAHTWACEWHDEIALADVMAQSYPLPSADTDPISNTVTRLAASIDIEWFSVVVNQFPTPVHAYMLAISVTPDQSELPQYSPVGRTLTGHMWLSVSSGAGKLTLRPGVLEMNGSITPTARAADALANQNWWWDGSCAEAGLMRDPAGRLKSYMLATDADNRFVFRNRYYDTTQDPCFGGDAYSGFSSLDLTQRYGPVPVGDPGAVSPTGAFYIPPPSAETQSEFPVYEIIVYGGRGQLVGYGTIKVSKSLHLPKARASSEVYVVGGIIDGPIPLPLENFRSVAQPLAGYGTITYGKKENDGSSRSVSNAWSVGFESSGHATKGVGLAWNISLKGGMGAVNQTEHETTLSYPLTQEAKYVNGEITGVGNIEVSSVAIEVTAYAFIDAFGRTVSDALTSEPGSAPKAASFTRQYPSPPTNYAYIPFAVEPGNLRSYTPEAWNATMKRLALEKDLGNQYGLYRGDNYFGDVLCANALVLDQKFKAPYLQFTWTRAGTTTGDFERCTSSYVENSWNLDTSVYAGISFGFGGEIFGMGEEQEAEFMVGVDYSHEVKQEDIATVEWGIALSEGWGPPEPTPDPSKPTVIRYEFRLYFLPMPGPIGVPGLPDLPLNYWVQEMIAYCSPKSDVFSDGAILDPGSGCWRIVYVVTAIQYEDGGGQDYQYAGPDYPSYYKTGSLLPVIETRIETASGLTGEDGASVGH
jgi:hypothetical protein